MYVYFDKQGKIVEVINDLPLRQGSNNANTISMYFEDENNFSLRTRYWIRFRKNDGTETNEIQIDRTKVRKTIPYNKHRDMKYFEDYKEYNFIEYTLGSEELEIDGLLLATVRVVIPREATVPAQILAQGLLTMNVEQGVITEDLGITQSQFDYLLDVIAKIGLDNEVPPQEIVFKGSFDTFAELEQEGERVIGYTYKVEEEHEGNHAGTNYTWNGTAWSPIGGGFDLSNYYIKKVVDDKDAKVLKDAKDYTDASIVGVFYTKGQTDYLDAQTLENAKEYADEKISEVYDKAEVLDLVANAKSYAVEQDILVKNFVELNYAKKSDIAGFYKFVSTIATYELLLTDGVRLNGNVYEITQASGGYPAGMNFAWSDEKNEWDALGGSVDLSVFYTKAEVDSKDTGTLTSANDYTDGIIGQAIEVFDAFKSDTEDRFDAIDESVNLKQPTLISGTNIKTINGETLLGGGDLTIQGGGSSGGVQIVEILSGAGTAANPFVIDKDFREFSLGQECQFSVKNTSGIEPYILKKDSSFANAYYMINNDVFKFEIKVLSHRKMDYTPTFVTLNTVFFDYRPDYIYSYSYIFRYYFKPVADNPTVLLRQGLVYSVQEIEALQDSGYGVLAKGMGGHNRIVMIPAQTIGTVLKVSSSIAQSFGTLDTALYQTGQTLEQKLATLGGTPTLSTIAYTLNFETQEINLNETLKIGGRYIISAKGGQYNGYYEFVFLGMDESVPIIKLVPMALNDGGNIHHVFLSVSSNSIEVTGDGEDLELLSEGQLRIFKLE